MATTPKNIWVIAFILFIISTMCLAGNEYFDDDERRKLMKSGGGGASPLKGIIDEIKRGNKTSPSSRFCNHYLMLLRDIKKHQWE
jgi:hypothetical protein